MSYPTPDISSGTRIPFERSADITRKAVVGYDNYTVSSICIPTITTVEVDLEKMAEVSVDIMAKKLIDPDYHEGRRIISGKLIVKNSVLDIRNDHEAV